MAIFTGKYVLTLWLQYDSHIRARLASIKVENATPAEETVGPPIVLGSGKELPPLITRCNRF